MEPVLRAKLEAALGRPVGQISGRAIGGGCINDAQVLDVDGDPFFFKSNSHALPRQFEAEAKGLKALRDSGTTLVIPEPIAWSDTEGARFLVTEYLEPGRKIARFDELLGQGLAELHACSHPYGFGFELDGYCGATPQPNGWFGGWREFYSRHRLGHQLMLANRKGFPGDSCVKLGRLIERLDEWIPQCLTSSLIHGDLWSGNVHVSPEGRPALIDPAAYFGHPEAELGMMALFGGFSPTVWESYAEAHRLEPGWRNRLDLYTLYHVLNHFVLFGSWRYRAHAETILRQYVG